MPVHLEYEEILEHVGSLGKYQLILFNIIASFSWKFATNMIVTVFHVIQPTFICADRVPDGVRNSNHILNISTTSDQCLSLNATNCDQFVFDRRQWHETITTQWQLVCSKSGLEPLVFASYALGFGFGIVLGVLADKFGRRPIILISCLLESVCTILESLSPNLTSYLAIHFTHGIFATVCLLATVCITEFVGCKHRSLVANLLWLYWCIGYMSVAGMAYFVRHWRWLQFLTCLPCLFYIAAYFVLHESPRWLIAQGRYTEALKVCEAIAKTNGRSIPAATTELLTSQAPVIEPEGNFKELFNTRIMLRKTLILLFAWFVISLIYYGISLDADFVTENVFLNTLLSGLIEIPAYIAAWIVAEKVGRRIPMIVIYVIMSITLIVANVLNSESIARTLTSLVSKLSVTSAYSVIIHYTAELYPTSIRNMGLFSCNAVSRFSAVLAPFISMNSAVTRTAATVVFGCFGLAAGCLLWFLPETKGIPLPQTIMEANIITPGKELTFIDLVQRRREEIAVYFVGRGDSATVSFQLPSSTTGAAGGEGFVNAGADIKDDSVNGATGRDANAVHDSESSTGDNHQIVFSSTKYLVNPFAS